MQTLGIADSTPRSENRLKSLFWPTINSGADVDYLGAQGYWVCTIVSVLTLLFLILAGQAVMGVLFFLFFYVGGMGVRERSVYAAVVVFILYFLSTVASGAMLFGGSGIVRILVCALLLSNLRATIIASLWKPGTTEAELPPRLGDTLGDKFADRLPLWLWPKIRMGYYFYSIALMIVIFFGWTMIFLQRSGLVQLPTR